MTPDSSFASLTIHKSLSDNLALLGYDLMTPIQAQSLPVILEGKDVIAQAKTGSGKTAVYGLSILNQLNVAHFAVQALILCPTRELAEQVCQALRQLARLMPNVKILNLSGGIPMKPQLDSLRHGAHIIVGTPGRIQKHLDRESLILQRLQTLVLDEADRMLDMGFFDAIKKVISFCPRKRQTLLFSATFPAPITRLATEFMQTPQHIVTEEIHEQADIEQLFFEVTRAEDKFTSLISLLGHYRPASTLIFCNTREQTNRVTAMLTKEGFGVTALSGEMEQTDRDMAMIRFANQSCPVLVATDVAARGLDIKELPAVISFDLAFDHDVHIHRIGRTGRAGCKGLALSLTTPADALRLQAIEENRKQPLTWGHLNSLTTADSPKMMPPMITLYLHAGRKDKIRPGDILGALTKDAGLPADAIGKIDVTALYSCVAIHRNHASKALQHLQQGKLKGRKVIVKKL